MSKTKWFALRKPSTGKIIATSANQIVPPKFCEVQKCCTIFTRAPFPLAVLKGGLGMRLRLRLLNSASSLLSKQSLCCDNLKQTQDIPIDGDPIIAIQSTVARMYFMVTTCRTSVDLRNNIPLLIPGGRGSESSTYSNLFKFSNLKEKQ